MSYCCLFFTLLFHCCLFVFTKPFGFYLIFPLETNLFNRIRELEERKSIVDESTQTTQAEAETKEDSGKEDKVLTQF